MTARKSPSKARRKATTSETGTAAPADTARVATTVRLTPSNLEGLRLLQRHVRVPINRMVNEAVAVFVGHQAALLEDKLTQTLASLRKHRVSDAALRQSLKDFAAAEARHGANDPFEARDAEGQPGPALSLVLERLQLAR